MDHRGRLFAGGALILIGVLALVGTIFHIHFWELCWPAGLIMIGLLLVFHPRWILPGSTMRLLPIGDISRSGEWQVQSEAFTSFVSDIELDFSTAHIPPGETAIRADGFVVGCKVIVPTGVGVSVSSSAFTTDAKFLDQKSEAFMTTYSKTSPDYENAGTKINLILNGFVVDLTVKRAVGDTQNNPSSRGIL